MRSVCAAAQSTVEQAKGAKSCRIGIISAVACSLKHAFYWRKLLYLEFIAVELTILAKLGTFYCLYAPAYVPSIVSQASTIVYHASHEQWLNLESIGTREVIASSAEWRVFTRGR